MLIGLPDLVKERKLSKIVIDRRLPNIYYHFSREFPIQNFQLPATIVTANTVTRLSKQRVVVKNVSRSSDAQRRCPYGSFTSVDVQHEA